MFVLWKWFTNRIKDKGNILESTPRVRQYEFGGSHSALGISEQQITVLVGAVFQL